MLYRFPSSLVAGLLAGGLALLLAHCANPVPPSGGPRDRTPPSLRFSAPERDAVNVPTDTRVIRLAFSEYVDRSSLTQSLTVTPALDGRLAFDWSGQEVAIEVPEALRDSTTYIFTFDTSLSDTRGVSLQEPLVLAFSTGPRISEGQLAGRVVAPERGQPEAQVDVYAYALPPNATRPPVPLPERPTYRTQSGDDGTFRFDYLREHAYFVLAVRDVDRDRRVDAQEARAAPPRLRLSARPDAPPLDAPWVLAPLDTTAPRVQRIRSLSSQRLEVRFTEPIRLDTLGLDGWRLRDSLAGTPVAFDALFLPQASGRVLHLQTDAMRPERRHRLRIPAGVVHDSLGQALPDTTVGFRSSEAPDTLRTRFLAFQPPLDAPDSTGAYPLLPGVLPGVRFNQPPDSTRLRRTLRLRDTTGTERAFRPRTDDGITYRLVPNDSLAAGAFVDVAVRQQPLTGRDTVFARRFRRITRRALGDLEGEVRLPDVQPPQATALPDSVRRDPLQRDSLRVDSVQVDSVQATAAAAVVVEAYAVESSLPVGTRRVTTAPGSTFVVRSVPEGSFRFRAFLDEDGDGRWSAGRLVPYVPPEPITWSEEATTSRPRWTNVLPAPLRFPARTLRAPAVSPDTTRSARR